MLTPFLLNLILFGVAYYVQFLATLPRCAIYFARILIYYSFQVQSCTLDIHDFGNVLDYGYGNLPSELVRNWAGKV